MNKIVQLINCANQICSNFDDPKLIKKKKTKISLVSGELKSSEFSHKQHLNFYIIFEALCYVGPYRGQLHPAFFLIDRCEQDMWFMVCFISGIKINILNARCSKQQITSINESLGKLAQETENLKLNTKTHR